MLMFFHAKETDSEKHTFWHFNKLSNDLITFWIRPESCHFYQIYLYKYLIFLLLCSIVIKSFDSMLKCQKVYFLVRKGTCIFSILLLNITVRPAEHMILRTFLK